MGRRIYFILCVTSYQVRLTYVYILKRMDSRRRSPLERGSLDRTSL